MHVEEAGTGPPVLALHGLGGSAHFFEALRQRLQTECSLLAVDLPGTGRSPSSPGFSMESWVRDLGDLLAARAEADGGGTAPVVILGHSMGTIIALKAWQAWPQRVRGLILVGGLPEVRPAIRERLTERLAALEHARDLTGWGARVSPGVFSPVTTRDLPEVVAAFERAFESQTLASYVRCVRILLEASAVDVPPTVTVPTLLVTGADDQYAPPDVVSAFAREIPGAVPVEVLDDCGHLPFLERPDDFAAVVKTFLRTC
jgi:pimeloyl-ACP methyl ester carboxylesterase